MTGILALIFFSVILTVVMLGLLKLLIKLHELIERQQQKEHEAEQYYNWVLEHGTEMQKQTALLYFQNKNLEALRRMVAIDILLG